MKPLRFFVALGFSLFALSSSPPAQETAPVNPDFAKVTGKLDAGGTFYLYVDVENAILDLVDQLEPILMSAGDPEARVIPVIARNIIKSLGLDQLDDLGISVTRLPDGMGRMKTYLHLTDRSGVFQLAGGNPHALESMNYIPSDAVFAMAQNVDLQSLLPLIEQVANGIGGPEAVTEFRDELLRLKQREAIDMPAILQSLGGEFALYLRLDTANMATLPLDRKSSIQIPRPAFTVLAKVKDDTLFSTIVAKMERQKKPLKEDASVAGFNVRVVDMEENPVGFKPVLAQGAGWFVFASDLNELRSALAVRESGKSIRASAEYQKLAAGLPQEVNGVTFVSPRLYKEIDALLSRLRQMPELNRDGGLTRLEMLIGSQLDGMGAVSVRMNEPQGLYTITQGDVTAGSAWKSMMIAPGAVMAAIAIPNFLEAQSRARVSRVRSDMRSLATAIEAYHVDWNRYPEWTLEPPESARQPGPDGAIVPSFRVSAPSARALGLTTPIAYITTYVNDPFVDEPVTFGYYSVEKNNTKGWILFSPGPDGVFDLDWKLYDPSIPQPSPELLTLSFDPTNGTVSGGDVFRVKQ